MAHLYCLIFLLLNVVFATNCTEIPCKNENLTVCFNNIEPNERTVRLVLYPNIPYFLSQTHEIANTLQSLTLTSQNKTVITIQQRNTVQLNILNINEVVMHNIEFRGNHSSLKTFFPFLTINNSRSVIITECEFQDILGLTMMITSTLNGAFSLDISHSFFNGTGNTNYPSQGVFVLLNQTGSASISVTHSNFSQFKVGPHSYSPSITYEQRTKYRALALEQTNTTHYLDNEIPVRNFLVSDCRFENNQAFVGAGLGLYSSDGANSNYTVQRCVFQKNTVHDNKQDSKQGEMDQIDVTGSGGGIAALLFNCKQCKLTLADLTMHENKATLGGAIKIGFYFSSAEVWIEISNCNFTNNTADSGSGLYIESQLVRRSVPKPAVLRNLRFTSNIAQGFGSGIFVAYLPLKLEGGMYFYDNSNTAFAVISSQIEVLSDLIFINNSGLRGGALFLSDNSQLLLNQSVSLYFEGNKAKDRGGAIYADSISLDLLYRNYGYTFYNVHCFIKHFIDFKPIIPDNYTQNITFKHNSAPKGSAIYTHTLSPCSWYSDRHPYSNISLALHWRTYSYTPLPGDDSSIIATAVAHYTIASKNETLTKDLKKYNKPYVKPNNTLTIKAKPGIGNKLFFVATDQLGLQEVSIATVQAVDGGKVKPCTTNGDESIFLTSSIETKSSNHSTVELSFCGKPGDEGEVQFKSLDGLTIERWMHVTLTDCPERRFWNSSGNICSCYDTPDSEETPVYTEVLNTSTYSWANGTFTQMSCPAGYCNLTKLRSHHPKNQCLSLSNSTECLDGRDGIGCSHCPGVLKSGSLRCVMHKCNQLITVLTVLGTFLGLFVIIAVLFLIRTSTYINEHITLRAHLGPYARSFVFFCQFMFLLYFNNDLGKKSKKAYETYQMIISKTGLFFNYDSCFTFGLTSSRGKVFEEYFIFLSGYVMIAFFALFIFGVLSRCVKFYNKLSIIFYVLVTYSYITYAPIAFTTFRLLSCGYLDQYSSTTGSHTGKRYIWFYDATQPCYGTNWDILMSSVAFLTLFLYLIPMPLSYMLFAVISKRIDLWKFVNKYLRPRREHHIQNEFRAHHTQTKYKYVVILFKRISNEYTSCFSESHFGFWIPITLVALLCLIVIQTNGALLGIQTDTQTQTLAVVCFFFLYIRVSIRITKDNYVQFYDSASIFLLCLACIFLIIDQNDSPNRPRQQDNDQFQYVVTYFPCVCYVFLFLFILSPPAIRFCVKKFWPQNPETEEKELPVQVEPFTVNPGSDEEVNDQLAPLLMRDPLGEVFPQKDIGGSDSYASHYSRGNSSSGKSVSMDSLMRTGEHNNDD